MNVEQIHKKAALLITGIGGLGLVMLTPAQSAACQVEVDREDHEDRQDRSETYIDLVCIDMLDEVYTPVFTVEDFKAKHGVRLISYIEKTPWDEGKIRLMDRIFSRFPRSFISSDTAEVPPEYLELDSETGLLKIALSYRTGIDTSRNTILFASRDLNEQNEVQTAIKLIHEIIHRNTFRGIAIGLLGEFGAEYHVVPDYYRSVYYFFGGSLDLPPKKLKNWAEKTREKLIAEGKWDETYGDMANLRLRLIKAIMHNYPYEMPAVLAEQAVYLNNSFISEMQKLFSPDILTPGEVAELYQFVKKDLLYGQEPILYLPK